VCGLATLVEQQARPQATGAAYAYARTGYHRGLDQPVERAGRGSGRSLAHEQPRVPAALAAGLGRR
jgi:hypothetical protein